MASVLIVGPVLELRELLRDLTAMALHDPVLVAPLSGGRPPAADGGDVVIADASMPEPACDRCVCWAADLGAIIVYYASMMSDAELEAFATRRNAPYFPFPNGPRRLANVLDDALRRRVHFALRTTGWTPPVSEVVARGSAVTRRAALAQARSQLIVEAAAVLCADSRRIRVEGRVLRDETQGRSQALRTAVMRSAAALRRAGAPPESSVAIVRETLTHSCAPTVDAVPGANGDADRWVLDAYHVA